MLAPSRYWVVERDGVTVAKFDTAGETLIPPEVANYEKFDIVSVSDESALVDETVDTSELTDEEKQMLGVPF